MEKEGLEENIETKGPEEVDNSINSSKLENETVFNAEEEKDSIVTLKDTKN